jgi:hypothetical protein
MGDIDFEALLAAKDRELEGVREAYGKLATENRGLQANIERFGPLLVEIQHLVGLMENGFNALADDRKQLSIDVRALYLKVDSIDKRL